MNAYRAVWIAAVGGLLISCGSSSNTKTVDAAKTVDAPGNTIDAPGSGSATELEGTWQVSCVALGSNNGPPGAASEGELLGFSGSTYSYKDEYFSDDACATIALTLHETGTFTIGAAETTPVGSKDINYVQTAITGTPATAAEATALNTGGAGSASACTGVTFAAGSASSLSGATCGGGGMETTNGATILGLYLLTTTPSPSTLELGNATGNERLGSVSPSARPTDLDSTSTFVKL